MTAFRIPVLVLLAAASLNSGCARFPELDAAVSDQAKAAPKPYLVDNRPLLAEAQVGVLTETSPTELDSRAAALQGRSGALLGPVISPGEVAEIEAAHQRLRTEAARVAPES